MKVRIVFLVMVVLALGLVSTSIGETNTFNVAAGDVAGLIAAIKAANRSGAATINLTNSTYTLTAVDNTDDDGNNGLPKITGNITINGNGATIQRDPSLRCEIDGEETAEEFRIFYMEGRAQVTLNNITVSNGCSEHSGGGIYFDSNFKENASLTITNSTISNNTAGGSGGGIETISHTTLTITNSTISNNRGNYGGGIGVYYCKVTITNSTISSNSAIYSGGGISTIGSTTTITNSTISGNSTSTPRHHPYTTGGGGIYSGSGRLTITNSTISGNSASGFDYGGGIYNKAHGIHGEGLIITNSTISGNSAGRGDGGGIYNLGVAKISFCTISDNRAEYTGGGLFSGDYSSSICKNTIVANNLAARGGANCMYHVDAYGGNMASDVTCGFVEAVDPLLGPLANNGGPTQTHALLPGSPAIDAATDCTDVDWNPITTDQRGVARPQGAACDIGAYESP